MVTATGVICLVTSLIGFVGIVLNNRAVLAIYNVMMWPCFGMIAAIGYTAYRKNKWNIEVRFILIALQPTNQPASQPAKDTYILITTGKTILSMALRIQCR